jgi:transcriptional regulator of acetoin/glycerol metabolism
VGRSAGGDIAESNRALIAAARPIIERLSRAIADTRYFAMLTDAQGVVIDVGHLPSGTDAATRCARDIARVGVDLSERAIGTSAIGTALAEQESVWLHRGEHFFDDTSVYSCAGAPLFGPRGDCVGMLDLTGVQVVERPELRHLATLSARGIENTLVMREPCELLLHLAWPGGPSSEATEGLLCIDAQGHVTGANAAARQMLHQPLARNEHALHFNDLFALPLHMMFDAARRGDAALEVPLWSGLRVQARPHHGGGGSSAVGAPAADARPRLRDVETAMIRKAVADARGNVAEAARALGISRATCTASSGAAGPPARPTETRGRPPAHPTETRVRRPPAPCRESPSPNAACPRRAARSPCPGSGLARRSGRASTRSAGGPHARPPCPAG